MMRCCFDGLRGHARQCHGYPHRSRFAGIFTAETPSRREDSHEWHECTRMKTSILLFVKISRDILFSWQDFPGAATIAIPIENSSIPNLHQGACLLSAGVLAGVEGPGLEVDEFRQPNTSPKSTLDPSATASSLRSAGFAPNKSPSPAQRSLFSERGYGGSQPPCPRFLLFPKPSRLPKRFSPSSAQKATSVTFWSRLRCADCIRAMRGFFSPRLCVSAVNVRMDRKWRRYHEQSRGLFLLICILVLSRAAFAQVPATQPRPSFGVLLAPGIAPCAIHVDGLRFALAAGTPLTAQYDWDFGDPPGRFNQFQGFISAHV